MPGAAMTGSEGAGAAIATQAAKHLKKSTLEMGGNDVFVVLEDADMDKALDAGVFSRLHISGQECICAKRFVLHEKIADEFLARFTQVSHCLKENVTERSPLPQPKCYPRARMRP